MYKIEVASSNTSKTIFALLSHLYTAFSSYYYYCLSLSQVFRRREPCPADGETAGFTPSTRVFIIIMSSKKMKWEDELEDSSSSSTSGPSRSFSKPSWLLFTIAELDERMKMVTSHTPERDRAADTFAERAESYYRKRPQLLSLLRQLYNSYLSLADRYCQTLAKHHQRRQSPPQTPPPPPCSISTTETFNHESDAESSLSYQTPQKLLDADTVVAELVMKALEYDIIVEELSAEERHWGESSKKIELQKSLLEVLESERLILLNENARLAYTAAELAEENKGLSAESAFMKMKACELARCMLKTREDYKVCMLSRKIEDLQGQIYGLEKRNKEYYEQLVKLEEEKKSSSDKKKNRLYSWSWSKGKVTLDNCFQESDDGSISTNSTANISFSITSTATSSSATTVADVIMKGSSSGKKAVKIWNRVKNFDVFNCGPHFHSAC